MAYTRSFQFTAAVRGFHVYRATWNPELNEKLICNFEPGNEFDRFAIQARSLRDGVQVTVGHLPREISRPTKFLLDRGAEVTATLIGTHYRRLVMGNYLEKDGKEAQQPLQPPRKIPPRKPVQNKSSKHQDIRVLFASNRNPPRCKETSSSSKVIILDD